MFVDKSSRTIELGKPLLIQNHIFSYCVWLIIQSMTVFIVGIYNIAQNKYLYCVMHVMQYVHVRRISTIVIEDIHLK